MLGFRGKGPVYRLDRTGKATMIDAVLRDHLGRAPEGLRILDIGCGNGDISEHFAHHNTVYGVDVEDKRKPLNRGFNFYLIASERLPFTDDFFDIVISNHVIEHTSDQRLHLSEIRRVLRPSGLAYLATPNRSSPLMEGHVGNNRVLTYREMRPLFEDRGFQVREYSVDLIKRPHQLHSGIWGLRLLPVQIVRWLRAYYPSQVFVLTPGPAGRTAKTQNLA